MFFHRLIVAVGLCLLISGLSKAAVTNVYWRVDLNQGTSVIAYGQGSTEQAAWDDCFRLRAITRAMTATETRKSAVAAVTTSAMRWCKNPMQFGTVSPDAVPTPINCVVSAWSPWSDPSWSTCSGGHQTRTLVRTRTIVTQPANGGTACPVLTESTTESRACTGSASLSWTPPTRNTDGTLSGLAGYRVSYGTSPNALTQTVQISNASATSYAVSNLTPGTYYFAVRAYNSTGGESANSNVVSKVVQ